MHNIRMLSEDDESYINGMVTARDHEREDTYSKKFDVLRSELASTCESYLRDAISKAIGDVDLDEINRLKEYKPIVDQLMALNSKHVGQSPSVDQFGMPATSKRADEPIKAEDGLNTSERPLLPYSDGDQWYNKGASLTDGTEFPIKDEGLSLEKENDLLRQSLSQTSEVVKSLEKEIQEMQKIKYLYESLAGLSKPVIDKAITELSTHELGELQADGGKLVKDYIESIQADKVGLTVGEANQAVGAAEDIGAVMESVGSFLGKEDTKKGRSNVSTVRDYIIKGLPKKRVLEEAENAIPDMPGVQSADVDVQKTLDMFSDWAGMRRFGN